MSLLFNRKLHNYAERKLDLVASYTSLRDPLKDQDDENGNLENTFDILLEWDELVYQYHAFKAYLDLSKSPLNPQDKQMVQLAEALINTVERKLPVPHLIAEVQSLAIIRRELHENAKEAGKIFIQHELSLASQNPLKRVSDSHDSSAGGSHKKQRLKALPGTPAEASSASSGNVSSSGSFSTPSAATNSDLVNWRDHTWSADHVRCIFLGHALKTTYYERIECIRKLLEDRVGVFISKQLVSYLLLHYGLRSSSNVDVNTDSLRVAFDEAFLENEDAVVARRYEGIRSYVKSRIDYLLSKSDAQYGSKFRQFLVNVYGTCSEPESNYRQFENHEFSKEELSIDVSILPLTPNPLKYNHRQENEWKLESDTIQTESKSKEADTNKPLTAKKSPKHSPKHHHKRNQMADKQSSQKQTNNDPQNTQNENGDLENDLSEQAQQDILSEEEPLNDEKSSNDVLTLSSASLNAPETINPQNNGFNILAEGSEETHKSFQVPHRSKTETKSKTKNLSKHSSQKTRKSDQSQELDHSIIKDDSKNDIQLSRGLEPDDIGEKTHQSQIKVETNQDSSAPSIKLKEVQHGQPMSIEDLINRDLKLIYTKNKDLPGLLFKIQKYVEAKYHRTILLSQLNDRLLKMGLELNIDSKKNNNSDRDNMTNNVNKPDTEPTSISVTPKVNSTPISSNKIQLSKIMNHEETTAEVPIINESRTTITDGRVTFEPNRIVEEFGKAENRKDASFAIESASLKKDYEHKSNSSNINSWHLSPNKINQINHIEQPVAPSQLQSNDNISAQLINPNINASQPIQEADNSAGTGVVVIWTLDLERIIRKALDKIPIDAPNRVNLIANYIKTSTGRVIPEAAIDQKIQGMEESEDEDSDKDNIRRILEDIIYKIVISMPSDDHYKRKFETLNTSTLWTFDLNKILTSTVEYLAHPQDGVSAEMIKVGKNHLISICVYRLTNEGDVSIRAGLVKNRLISMTEHDVFTPEANSLIESTLL